MADLEAPLIGRSVKLRVFLLDGDDGLARRTVMAIPMGHEMLLLRTLRLPLKVQIR